MNTRLLYAAMLLSATVSFSQTFEWVNFPTTNITFDPTSVGYTTVVDTFGAVYVSGFQDDPFFYNDTFGTVFYHKYAADGSLLFSKTFNGTATMNYMTSDSEGNVLLAISHFDILEIDTTSINNTEDVPQQVLIKMSPLGDVLWHHVLTISGSSIQNFKSIAVDVDDNIYVGYDNFANSFIKKLSSIGVELSTITQSSVNLISSVDVDSDGNIYVAGSCANPSSTFADVSQPTDFEYSIYVVKYSPQGVFQWQHYVEDITCASPMVKAHTPNAVYFSSELLVPFPVGSQQPEGPTSGGVDFFITKLDADGNFIWLREVPGNGSVQHGNRHYLDIDTAGYLYFTGSTFGSIDWGNNISSSTSPALNSDTVILQYDSLGQLLQATTAGGINDDKSNSVGIAPDGSIYMTGVTRGNATFGSINHTTANALDYTVFLAKMDNQALNLPEVRDNSVKVYPNPVTDWLTISTLQPIINIQVYNLNGQIFQLPQQDHAVDMQSLANGVYIIEITTDNEISYVKVVR